MRRYAAWTAAVAGIAAGAVMATAFAQTARNGGGANTQLLEQLQQLASERTGLQAENAKLKSELADVKKDRDGLKAGQQSLERRAHGSAAELAQSKAQHEATQQELTQYRDKMQELIAKFRETVQKLRDAETAGAAAKQSLATRDRELSVCVDHNVALYKLNGEVLTRLEREGVWSRVAETEPFTKIKRTQLENLIDDYRTRADEQRASPTHAGAAQPASVAPAPATSASPSAPAATGAAAAGMGTAPAPADNAPAAKPAPPPGP
jgi:chromosome segregation ATPase